MQGGGGSANVFPLGKTCRAVIARGVLIRSSVRFPRRETTEDVPRGEGRGDADCYARIPRVLGSYEWPAEYAPVSTIKVIDLLKVGHFQDVAQLLVEVAP